MPRDHAIRCRRCGVDYDGMSCPERCNCDARSDSSRVYPGPQCEHTERIATLELLVDSTETQISMLVDAVVDLRNALKARAELAESVGLIHDRRTDNRRTASDVPKPSRRGKGRRK